MVHKERLRKIYVGNLSYNTTNDDLSEAFGPFGEVVSAQVIMDCDTGRSRGFGFVEMADETSVRDAISGLNGKDVGGRSLTVNEAKPRESQSNRGGGGSRW